MARLQPAVAWVLCVATLCAALPLGAVRGAENEAALQKEADAIKAEIDLLQKDLDKSKSARGTVSKVDQALDKKKPDYSVKAACCKVQIGGLVQAWYTWYQHDNRGLFDDPKNNVLDTNDASDNSSFRVRRAQLSFTIKANPYVTAFVMIDPAAEANSFPLITDNQAVGGSIFKRSNNVAIEADLNAANKSAGLGNFQTVQNLQEGFGVVNRVLQDAYINFHNNSQCPGDFDWHHDFQVGQFVPAFGEEGMRSNAQLDFAERSFVGILGNNRDLGAQLHGSWINDRFQYWGGVYDGALDYHMSNGDGIYIPGANRSDTNNAKDVGFRVLGRPISNECWGDLELGYSMDAGYHGKGGEFDANANPQNGLERPRTFAMRQDAWASYAPRGCFNGLWVRGEWGWFKDRDAPDQTVAFNRNGGTSYLNLGDNTGLAQGVSRAFSVQGWYAAAGYRFDKGFLYEKGNTFEKCSPKLSKLLRPVELAFRYQMFENVLTANLADPTKTDVFNTRVYTGGINYYLDQNAKIQMNYNAVIDPENHAGLREFHPVRNNSFVINFQVAF